jgi:hypothetical protein
MRRDTPTVDLGDIQKIVQQIVAHCHPQKVILFGSYARGTPTADSDVDLLVIMETEEPPLHAAAPSLQPLIIRAPWIFLFADLPTWRPLWHARASLPPGS